MSEDIFAGLGLTKEQLLLLSQRAAISAADTEGGSQGIPKDSRSRHGSPKDAVVQRAAAHWLVHLRHSKHMSFSEMAATLDVTAARVQQLYHQLVGKFGDLEPEDT